MKALPFLALPMMLLAGCQQPATEKADTPAATSEAAADQNAAQKAYASVNERMHKAMGGSIDADADVAFMQGMIPHHEGAVEMAKVALEHGKDPEVRALAQKVIAAQEAEIKEMQAWLEKRGAKPVAAPATGEVDHKAMGH